VRIGRRTSGIQRPYEGFAATQIHQALGSGFFRDNVLVEASEAAICLLWRATAAPGLQSSLLSSNIQLAATLRPQVRLRGLRACK
jgi:hypothetical protein